MCKKMYSLEDIAYQIENDINYLKKRLAILEKEKIIKIKINYGKEDNISYIEIYYKNLVDSIFIGIYSEKIYKSQTKEEKNKLINKLINKEKIDLDEAIKGYQKDLQKIKKKIKEEKLDK